MKYRIKVETTHEELFKLLLKLVDDKMHDLGVPPDVSGKKLKTSQTVNLKAPIHARTKLKDVTDEEGRTRLKYLFPNL